MTEKEIKKYLTKLERELLNSDRYKISFAKGWSNVFNNHSDAGVYAIFEQNKLVYVGETGHLKKRMNDLRRTVNHSFRRSLGTKLYEKRSDYSKATSKKKFSPEIEELLSGYCEKEITISLLLVKLGRQELEEYIVGNNPTILNVRKKRK